MQVIVYRSNVYWVKAFRVDGLVEVFKYEGHREINGVLETVEERINKDFNKPDLYLSVEIKRVK